MQQGLAAESENNRKGWPPVPLWLTVLLVFAIALFTWRPYQSVILNGWV
jgi:hypothetical protein